MVWKGAGGDPGIWWTTFDRKQWRPSGQQKIPGAGASQRPALAVFKGVLYMAWKGVGNDPNIFFTTYTDKGGWTAQQHIPNVGTSDGPALTVYGNGLYLAWVGCGGDPSIWWSQTWDGHYWEPQHRVDGVGASGGPSLAQLNAINQNLLCMAWKGIGGDQQIWWSTYNGGNWSTPSGAVQQIVPDVGTTVGPTLVNFGGPVYMAWKGAGQDSHIWWTSAGGGFDYVCSFEGIPGTELVVTDQQELWEMVETLEVYNVNSSADYPAAPFIKMRDIQASTLDLINPLTIEWNIDNAVTNYGQHTTIISNSIKGNGEVDLWLTKHGKAP